jgi:hypothetical protein
MARLVQSRCRLEVVLVEQAVALVYGLELLSALARRVVNSHCRQERVT